MKKKTLVSMLLVAAIAAQTMTVFAGRSTDSDDSDVAADTNVPSSVVTVDQNGTIVSTDALTSGSVTGTDIAVVVDTTTASGQQITINDKGEAVVGDHAISFATGSAATAGLPDDTVDKINKINSGADLSTFMECSDLTSGQAIQDGKLVGLATAPRMDLTGYHSLSGTHAIVTKNAATGEVMDTPTETVIYVPNLVDGLSNVSILYYDNATGRWLVLPATKVDPVTKLVYVNVTGSGTLSVIYKK